MSVGLFNSPHSGADSFSSSDQDDVWLSNLTQLDALRDSPVFRHSLTKAELLVAQIQAHYSVALESFQQAIKTGEAFASALSNVAECANLKLFPKQTCTLLDLPTRRSGLDCGASEGLQQVQKLLLGVATCTSKLAVRFKEPVRFIAEAQKQLDRLLVLRASFHRASDQLDSLRTRSASIQSNKSQTDFSNTDTQVNEVHQIYRNTATAYLTNLRTAISFTPLITCLHSQGAVLSAERDFISQLKHLFEESLDSASRREPPTMLLEFLSKLTNWAETTCRMACSTDQSVAPESLSLHKQNSHICGPIQMEGYLFKRSRKRTWRTWARRWFCLSDNQLVYCKRVPSLTSLELQSVIHETNVHLDYRLKASMNRPQSCANGWQNHIYPEIVDKLISQYSPCWKTMESDLRLCTAREGNVSPERRFTFELISHGNRVHVLQADTFSQRERWIEVLRSGLMHFHQSNDSLLDVSRSPDCGMLSDHCNQSRALNSSVDAQPNLLSAKAHRTTPSVPVSQQLLPDYDRLRSQGAVILWREPHGFYNRSCGDCSLGDANWASINLGVTLCTQCAAAHRSLGVHISKIRSVTLDNWEPELLHLMLHLGNSVVNAIYEANLSQFCSTYPRPTAQSSTEVRLHWIRAKWVQCQFVRFPLIAADSGCGGKNDTISWIQDIFDRWLKLRQSVRHLGCQKDKNALNSHSRTEREKRRATILSDLSNTFANLQRQITTASVAPSQCRTLLRTREQDLASAHLLLAGAQLGCPPLMLAALATGAQPDGYAHQRTSIAQHSTYPPLIAAVRTGSLAACEFLLLNGADVDLQDQLGQTALHHACLLHRVHLVCLLLRRRADIRLADKRGRLPLDIAIELADADIVTLLRLQRLHNDDRDTDFNIMDDMVTDVFRDYTSRAYFFDSDSDLSDCATFELRRASSSPSFAADQRVSIGDQRSEVGHTNASSLENNHRSVTSFSTTSSASMIQTSDTRRRRFFSPPRSRKKTSTNGSLVCSNTHVPVLLPNEI